MPHYGAFAEDVEVFFDQTAYSIFENQLGITVSLRLSDTYREDIVVNVAVGELQGGCIQENSEGMLCQQ